MIPLGFLSKLAVILLLLPLALRLLGTYAILSGPWSLIAGVLGPILGLVAAATALAQAVTRRSQRMVFVGITMLNLGLAIEDVRWSFDSPEHAVPVMTWNVALGYSQQHRCVQKVIARHEPKIVALQEIRQEGLESVARALDMRCTWAGYFPQPGSNGLGLCVPKAWEIHLAQQRRFTSHTQYAYLFAEIRPTKGPAFNVMNVHLQSPELSRQQKGKRSAPSILGHTTARQIWQLFEVLRVAQGLDDPLLIAGDFNSTPNTWVHGQMRDRFVDAHRQRGRGVGSSRWIGDLLPVRIDYLYASKHLDWRGVTRALDSDGCSDHQPVIGWLNPPT